MGILFFVSFIMLQIELASKKTPPNFKYKLFGRISVWPVVYLLLESCPLGPAFKEHIAALARGQIIVHDDPLQDRPGIADLLTNR
jgi:hypothetical protein